MCVAVASCDGRLYLCQHSLKTGSFCGFHVLSSWCKIPHKYIFMWIFWVAYILFCAPPTQTPQKISFTTFFFVQMVSPSLVESLKLTLGILLMLVTFRVTRNMYLKTCMYIFFDSIDGSKWFFRLSLYSMLVVRFVVEWSIILDYAMYYACKFIFIVCSNERRSGIVMYQMHFYFE